MKDIELTIIQLKELKLQLDKEERFVGSRICQNAIDQLSSQLEAQVSEILADFENLLIEIMSNRKCSIGSIDNYYDLHLEVKKINELYSKLQYYHIVSQKSR